MALGIKRARVTEGFDDFFHRGGIENIGGHTNNIRPIVFTAKDSVGRLFYANGAGTADTVRLHADALPRATEKDANTMFVPRDGVSDCPSGFVEIIILDIFESTEVLDFDHTGVAIF